ncbi:hypothetical protein Leryth_016706 [Lithospermum erythrorhizon]|nr:hypothetical protein Leryth_016706 [Lithospermum erythrorhizon]
MVIKKPRIVIIGAGMAGLAAANKLYKSASSKELFELLIVEGGTRIGGRINTKEFCGDKVEIGATWIHGINGSPIHQIAQDINSLESEKPWECMNWSTDEVTIAEGGLTLNQTIVKPINDLFNKLVDFSQGKTVEDGIINNRDENGSCRSLSLGSFLRKGLEAYWGSRKEQEEVKVNHEGSWNKKSLESAIFSMFENTRRTYTSAGNLNTVDFNAEREYSKFPGEEITIAKGYSSIIESLASVLPAGLIQLGRKVSRIEWQNDDQTTSGMENSNDGYVSRPVKLHFVDGSSICADHVILTVSLGVLKHGVLQDSCLFTPALPNWKIQAISRLGFGVVNKLFAGEEALALETLSDEEILDGVSATISNLLSNCQSHCNGTVSCDQILNGEVKFGKVLRSKWGTNPLFLGSYSYAAIGSSGDDFDTMAEPLPKSALNKNVCPLQILFAGEATHRTHYSTAHGAYLSGIREANRLLQHYNCSNDI